LISHIVQRGRCTVCGARIDPAHLWIELICGLVGGLALWLSPDASGVAGAIFGWLLVALAALDLRHFWLPDRLTALLALGGLAAGLAGLEPPLGERIIGGIAGFGILTLIALTYRALRKREGLGGGDPKLLGGIGLWLGWQALPLVVLGASGVGIAWVLLRMLLGKAVRADDRLPFGTLLAMSAFSVWVFSA
jgi:leader peptidase (prepilin peptidase) / N-methyltransferase